MKSNKQWEHPKVAPNWCLGVCHFRDYFDYFRCLSALFLCNSKIIGQPRRMYPWQSGKTYLIYPWKSSTRTCEDTFWHVSNILIKTHWLWEKVHCEHQLCVPIIRGQKVGYGMVVDGTAKFQALKLSFQGLKFPVKSLVLLVSRRMSQNFQALKFHNSGTTIPYPTFCQPFVFVP